MWHRLSALSKVFLLSYSGFILLALISTLARFSRYEKAADQLLFSYGYGVLDWSTRLAIVFFSAAIVWGCIEYRRFVLDKSKARTAISKIISGAIGLALVMFVVLYIDIVFTPLIPPPQ